MRKIIILAILLLSLASTSWAGHHNTLLGTSLGTKSPGGGGGGGWGVTLWGQAPGWGH